MPPPAASRKRLSEWTIFGDAEQGVLFDRSRLEVKPLGGELAGIVASIIEAAGDIPDEATEWHEIAGIIEGIDRLPGLQAIDRQVPREVLAGRDAPAQAGGLYKLAISVADTCNLACAYCYANQGRFERSAGRVMAPELAERLVDNAVRRFPSIDTVQFIGGEPTLNLPAIERACEAFRRAVEAGQLPELPRFVVTTNGVRLGESFLRLASAYDLHPTISLDGPRAVHDRGRVAANGEPTYDQIRANIDALEDAGLSVEYEATFSRLHLEEGLHLIDLCHWFRDELGVRVLHAPPVSAGPYTPATLTLSLEERIREYSAAAEWAVDNLLLRGEWIADSFAARVIEALLERSRSPSICVAGNDLLCIAADGGVYPCWMFIGEEALRLGSFAEPDPRPWDWMRAHELFAPGDLDAYPECRSCFAQPLCFGCRGFDHRATGGLEEKLACAFPRAIIASVVTRFFHRGPAEETTAADYLARPSFGERLFVCSMTGR